VLPALCRQTGAQKNLPDPQAKCMKWLWEQLQQHELAKLGRANAWNGEQLRGRGKA